MIPIFKYNGHKEITIGAAADADIMTIGYIMKVKMIRKTKMTVTVTEDDPRMTRYQEDRQTCGISRSWLAGPPSSASVATLITASW